MLKFLKQVGDYAKETVQAGYMELSGAAKDADCEIVEGRISTKLGCCNLFDPESGAQEFRCGTCEFVGG